jgi:hypothetical protein
MNNHGPSFPRKRESMLNQNSKLSMGSRFRGNDGLAANYPTHP